MLFRQNVCSDPVVQFYEPRINCQVCLAEGHTQISCPYAESKVASDMPYADVVFYSYVHPDNRPDCLKWYKCQMLIQAGFQSSYGAMLILVWIRNFCNLVCLV